MPEKWTGEIVGDMHVNRITSQQLAEKLGWTKSYLSRVLTGQRKPKGAKEKIAQALDELLKEGE